VPGAELGTPIPADFVLLTDDTGAITVGVPGSWTDVDTTPAGDTPSIWAAPDLDAFPCLALARAAGEAGDTAPCVLNAANEVAVAAFLDADLPFLGIAGVVEQTLAQIDCEPAADLAELTAIDTNARRVASARTRELVH
jgi:hypothetical protein